MRVTAEWDRNSDAFTVGYQVSVGLAPGSYVGHFNAANQTRLSLDLPPGAAYYLVVRAYDAQSRLGPPSQEFIVDLTSVPQDPVGLRATISGGRVTLEWNPPASGGRPLQYAVSVGTSPGASDVVNSYVIGATPSASGVLPPGVYFARVQAANLMGAGPPTADISFEIASALRVQGPTSLSLRWQGANAVLTWTPPSGAGRDMPAAYVLEAGSAAGMTNIASINVGTATSYTTSVPAGTYFVRVRGIGDGGTSDPSNEVVVRGAHVPGAPSNLLASGRGSSVSLSWSAPAAQVSGYLVEAGTASGRSDIGVLNVGAVTTFATVAAPGVYFVRVRAVSAQGVGAPSNEVVIRR
jgi:hypothetical protein